jgi:hypothetical protein
MLDMGCSATGKKQVLVIYVQAILTGCNAVFCIYGFCMFLTVNSHYRLKQH